MISYSNPEFSITIKNSKDNVILKRAFLEIKVLMYLAYLFHIDLFPFLDNISFNEYILPRKFFPLND